MVQLDGTKVSKSLGNLVMIDDLLTSWSPDALPVYLASHHYRKAWNHDPSEIDRAQQLVKELREAVAAQAGGGPSFDPSGVEAALLQAMDDDLNTPKAFKAANEMARRITGAAKQGRDVRTAQQSLHAVARIFGLRLDARGPETRVSAGWERHLEKCSENP
jgi:cysteinyl-tRNA synthetase